MSVYDELLKTQTIPHAYENWAEYRRELTEYLTGVTDAGSTLAVFGAGSCNDLDLCMLREHFSQITLIDCQKESMFAALDTYQLREDASLVLKEADFLGITPAEYREYAERLREACGWKVTRILIGGTDRSGSTLAALRAAEQDGADRLLLHDAARPLVTEHTVLSVCEALEQVPAATAAVPATDTIAVSDGVRRLCYTPDRQTLWHVQTPQGFSVGLLRRAYERKEQLALSAATDDCGLVRSCFPEVPIALADGSRQAMKLTYPEDLYLLETLLRIH